MVVRSDSRRAGDQLSGANLPAGRRCQEDQSKTKQGGADEPSKPAELGNSRSGLQFGAQVSHTGRHSSTAADVLNVGDLLARMS